MTSCDFLQHKYVSTHVYASPNIPGHLQYFAQKQAFQGLQNDTKHDIVGNKMTWRVCMALRYDKVVVTHLAQDREQGLHIEW